MFIAVKYYKDALVSGFAGAAYTYETHREDVAVVGTKVAAPVKNRKTGVSEDKKAIVVETGLSKPPFPCAVITQTWEETGND